MVQYISYNSVRREVLYDVLTEFGILTELVKIITMCFKEI